MEDDAVLDVYDGMDTDLTDVDDEMLAARPKGDSRITDGTSNT